jgi:hypothetical protein
MSEFNAADARNKVRDWKLSGLSSLLVAIEVAAEHGNTCMVFTCENNFNDLDSVRHELNSRGFKVKMLQHEKHGPELHISW